MKQGDRVRIANYDCSFYERLNSYNKLTWSPRMAMYIGKIGIIREITVESVQVTFFSWGPAEATTTISSNSSTHKDKKVFSETIRNTLVEATYSWHPKVVLSAQTICMLDGDRAILIRDKDFNKAIMVSIRVIDEETFSLRLPHAEAVIWKQSQNPNDVILPIYAGQNLSFLMRDRNLPTHLVNINRTPARVVFGTNAVEQNSNNIVEALKYWAETGDDQKFRLALHYDPDSKNAVIDGQTPLMIAVDLGLWTATAALICMGAETKVSDPHGNGLYHIAAKRGHEQIIEGLMIFSMDDINSQNFKGETALHSAVLSGSVSCVVRLLNALTLDPNIQDNDGNTALHVLSTLNNISTREAILHRLLSNMRVDQLVMNNDGLTPLQVAIISNQQKVVESMIHMKPSLLVSNSCHSLPPLHLAAAYGHAKVLETILRYSDVNKTTKASRTALHFAVERWDGNADQDMQRLSCIQSLVSTGVPLNTRDCDGMTALHLAAQTVQNQVAITENKINAVLQMKKSNMRLEELASALRPQWPAAVICFLIAHGADPFITDRSGCTTFELVKEASLKLLFEQYAACRPRSCIPMSSSSARVFDTSGVTMCTFNCDDNVADIVFVPCGHRVVCTTCAGSTLLRRCPLCYQQIIAAKDSSGEEVKIGSKIIQSRKCKGLRLDESIKLINESEIQRIAQEAVERAQKAAEAEKNEIVHMLRDKLEQLELEVTCAICMDQRCSIVFQCGHTACSDCSSPSKLKLCHICRQPIKRRTTIYT